MNDGLRSAATLICTRRSGSAPGGRKRPRTGQALFAHAPASANAGLTRAPAAAVGPATVGGVAATPEAIGSGIVGLELAIAEVARTRGSNEVVDLLVTVLTGATVTTDGQIDRHLDRLKAACRQTRRYREAIPVIKRIAVLNPARRHEVAAELAIVHAHLSEHATGAKLLESALAAQRRLAPHRRSTSFFVAAEIAARVLGEMALAREIVECARSTGADLAVAGPVSALAGSAVR
jgi:hypothetical protein